LTPDAERVASTHLIYRKKQLLAKFTAKLYRKRIKALESKVEHLEAEIAAKAQLIGQQYLPGAETLLGEDDQIAATFQELQLEDGAKKRDDEPKLSTLDLDVDSTDPTSMSLDDERNTSGEVDTTARNDSGGLESTYEDVSDTEAEITAPLVEKIVENTQKLEEFLATLPELPVPCVERSLGKLSVHADDEFGNGVVCERPRPEVVAVPVHDSLPAAASVR
jgi:hypothetical protein